MHVPCPGRAPSTASPAGKQPGEEQGSLDVGSARLAGSGAIPPHLLPVPMEPGVSQLAIPQISSTPEGSVMQLGTTRAHPAARMSFAQDPAAWRGG